jgi:hypothetical protein
MMIELFNTFRNNKNRETKSGQIFQYIISQDFIQKMKAIERNATELAALQKAEEKDHTKLWEMRKKRVQDLERDRNSLDAKIEAIVRDTKEAFENQTTPVFVKREKRKTANFRN